VRIGLFSPTYPEINGTGGIPVYTQSLATGLLALGSEVHVLIHDATGRLEPSFSRDGVTIHAIRPRYAPLVSRWLPNLRECVETSAAAFRLSVRHGLDVFEFPNFEGMGAALWTAGRPRIVVRLHTSTAECLAIEGRAPSVANRFDVWRERVQCRMADALTVSTAAHRNNMVAELALAEQRISLLPLGLPDASPVRVREPRPRGTPPRVVYVGRLEPRKGTLDLLEAIPKVLASVPDAEFVFVGTDRPKAPGGRTHAQWARENLPASAFARIHLTGFVDEPTRERLLAGADVFVAPSIYESFGLIFLEAMRASVPVIGTTVGGIPEVVEDGVTGLLVPPRDSVRLADAVVRLLTDESLRLRLARTGRRRFTERFSNVAMAERTLTHHHSLLV
jgi:glycosyltransferase involved in cell wall biosynthesis